MKKHFIIIFSLLLFLTSCKYSIEIKENIDSKTGSVFSSGVTIENEEIEENENLETDTIKEETQSGTAKTEVQNLKYCLFDECIPTGVEVKEKDGFYSYEIESNDDSGYSKFSYKLSNDYTFFEREEEKVMQNYRYKVIKIDDIYVKTNMHSNCGGAKTTQNIYDKSGKKINDFIFDGYDKKVNIGNIEYYPTLAGDGRMLSKMEDYNDYKSYYGEKGSNLKFKSVEEFQKFIENDSLNVGKKIYKSYVVEYEKYPGVYFFYDSKNYDNSSIRVVWLGTDKEYLGKNIAENGDYLDLNITNKIIGYYNVKNISLALFDKNGNRIESVTKEKLPVFNMKKLNDKGNYLVYLKDGYSIRSLAEMCKPVVYYYSDQKEENSLSLNPKTGDYFTKLIPELDENNSWDFSSKDGKIEVENKFYDYLYYSLMTIDYKHNTDGWIVYGENIEEFFNDKLSKINFRENEKKDFIDYWKNEYKKDKYYFVSFKYKEELDEIIKLDFEKEVENEFRVLLDSYEILDYSQDFYSPFLYENVGDKFDKMLIKKFERNNSKNEVFEWGGVLVRSDKTIIK